MKWQLNVIIIEVCSQDWDVKIAKRKKEKQPFLPFSTICSWPETLLCMSRTQGSGPKWLSWPGSPMWTGFLPFYWLPFSPGMLLPFPVCHSMRFWMGGGAAQQDGLSTAPTLTLFNCDIGQASVSYLQPGNFQSPTHLWVPNCTHGGEGWAHSKWFISVRLLFYLPWAPLLPSSAAQIKYLHCNFLFAECYHFIHKVVYIH